MNTITPSMGTVATSSPNIPSKLVISKDQAMTNIRSLLNYIADNFPQSGYQILNNFTITKNDFEQFYATGNHSLLSAANTSHYQDINRLRADLEAVPLAMVISHGGTKYVLNLLKALEVTDLSQIDMRSLFNQGLEPSIANFDTTAKPIKFSVGFNSNGTMVQLKFNDQVIPQPLKVAEAEKPTTLISTMETPPSEMPVITEGTHFGRTMWTLGEAISTEQAAKTRTPKPPNS